MAEQSRSLGERIWPSNQEVSAKGFGRATKKSRRKDLAEQSRSLGERILPSNQEVSATRKLAEQPRSLGERIWPSNQEVSVTRKLAEQQRSLGGKEFGRAIKKSRQQGIWLSNEKSLRTMKRVCGPRKESYDHDKSPSDYKS